MHACGKDTEDVAVAYLANRESFDSFDMRFDIRFGSAASADEALKNGPTKVEATAKVRWLQRKNLFRYEIETDDKPRPIGNTGGAVGIFMPTVILGDGERTLSLAGLMPGGMLHGPGGIPFSGLVQTPWDLGGMLGPGEIMTPGKGIRLVMGFDPTRLSIGPVEGELSSVELRIKTDSGALQRYRLDSRRAFLPIDAEIETPQGQVYSRAVTTAFGVDAEGRHYPERVVYMLLFEGHEGVQATEVVVRAFDTAFRPDDEAFTYVAPRKLQINTGAQARFVDTGTRLSALELQGLWDGVETNPDIRAEDAFAKNVEPSTPNRLRLALGVGVAIAAVSILTFLARRLRR